MTVDQFNFQWKTPASSGKLRGHHKKDSVCISTTKTGRGDKQITIRIYEGVMEEMRWVCGDRVSFGYDLQSKKIAIKRVPVGGYKLSPSASGKKDRLDSIGKHKRCVVKLTADDAIHKLIIEPISVVFENCLDIDGMLVIPLKDQNDT